jgi:superfamily II DNA or RNA helicase
MKLRIDNLRTVVEANDIESDWLFEYLAFDNPQARFYKRHISDTKTRLYNRITQSFPSGFVELVENAAPQSGFDVEVLDARQQPVARDMTADLSWLRDYQLRGVQIAAKKTRGILHLPTGSGKTEIAVALATAFPCRWTFLVHRASLMQQAAERYEQRTGAPAGRIGEGNHQIERFTVATFQTLYAKIKNASIRTKDPEVARLLDLIVRTEGLIVDESHVLPANSFYRVVMRMKRAFWRIGISGTPLARGDRRSLIAVGALGPVIYRVKPELLIKRGLLARPDIRMLKIPTPSNKPTYQGVYGEGIVRNASRNNLIVAAAKSSAKPALIFVKEIKHGKAILDRLTRGGIAAEFVWGNTVTPSRMASVKRLIRGDIDVLICSVIFQEGVDIPELKSVIIATAGKSVIAAIQRVGRGMRMSSNKGGTFEVWDFYDMGNRLLERHSKERMRAYEREGYTVNILQKIP